MEQLSILQFVTMDAPQSTDAPATVTWISDDFFCSFSFSLFCFHRIPKFTGTELAAGARFEYQVARAMLLVHITIE